MVIYLYKFYTFMNLNYFEIGICCGKIEANYGTLMRSAYQLGADGVFTIGAKYRRVAADTPNATKHIPCRNYQDVDDFIAGIPRGCEIVAIEDNGKPLKDFVHPKFAIYLLGNESTGIPGEILARCDSIVSIESIRHYSYNVAVAGSIVMYDRMFK